MATGDHMREEERELYIECGPTAITVDDVQMKYEAELDDSTISPAPTTPSRGSRRTSKKGSRTPNHDAESPRKAKRATPWTKPMNLSPVAAEFFGHTQLSRPEATSELWKYIKSHNLQDPSDRREILCDGKLRTLLGCDRVGMFTMIKILSTHFSKPNAEHCNEHPTPVNDAASKDHLANHDYRLYASSDSRLGPETKHTAGQCAMSDPSNDTESLSRHHVRYEIVSHVQTSIHPDRTPQNIFLENFINTFLPETGFARQDAMLVLHEVYGSKDAIETSKATVDDLLVLRSVLKAKGVSLQAQRCVGDIKSYFVRLQHARRSLSEFDLFDLIKKCMEEKREYIIHDPTINTTYGQKIVQLLQKQPQIEFLQGISSHGEPDARALLQAANTTPLPTTYAQAKAEIEAASMDLNPLRLAWARCIIARDAEVMFG